MTNIIHHGSEITSFPPTGAEESVNSSSNVSHRTDPGEFDSAFSRVAIGLDAASIRAADFPPTNNAWLHFLADPTTNSQIDGFMCGLFDQNGSLCMGLDTVNGAPQISVRSAVGATFGVIGSAAPAPGTNVLTQFDINIDFRPAVPRVDVYINKTLVQSESVPLFGFSAASTGITSYDMRDPGSSSNEIEYSEIIFASESTLDMRLLTLDITADGDLTGLAGNLSEVAGFAPGLPGLVSAVAGTEHSFQLRDTGPESVDLNPISVAVHVEFSPSADPLEPQNLAAGLRIGTANFAQLFVSDNAGRNQGTNIFDFTNPVTGLPWTLADINTLQLYTRTEP